VAAHSAILPHRRREGTSLKGLAEILSVTNYLDGKTRVNRTLNPEENSEFISMIAVLSSSHSPYHDILKWFSESRQD
jgi:hypothetical protein